MGVKEFEGTVFTKDQFSKTKQKKYSIPKDFPNTVEEVAKIVKALGFSAGEHLAIAEDAFNNLWNSISTPISKEELSVLMWKVREKLLIASYSLMKTEEEFKIYFTESEKMHDVVKIVLLDHKEKENGLD